MMQKRIDTCRQTALDILKPDSKQLEYGLELHRDALVWDAYGFAPCGMNDYSRIKKIISENGSADELVLAHEEELQMQSFRDDEIAKLCREGWKASGVDCIFQNAGEEGNSIERMILRLARFTAPTDLRRDLYMRATIPADVMNAKNQGLKSLYLTTNGVPLPTAFRNEKELLFYIHVFFELGVRMMHLTYNRRNLLGDGCGETTDGGLSDLGKRAITEMNRVGVIPDVAHCGQRTSLGVAQVSTSPVVASHSVCSALAPHCRAKTDEVIKAIAASGGYIGIVNVNHMVGGMGDIAAMLNHIDYVAEKFGPDHVAIGSDSGFLVGSSSYEEVKTRTRFESFWPASWRENRIAVNPDYNSLAWTNWPMFTVGMHMRGYADEDIRKIIGLNVMRVCRQTLASSEYSAMITN